MAALAETSSTRTYQMPKGATMEDAMRDADTTDSATLVAIHCESEMSDSERELIESQRFRDFLPTKNGCMVFDLVGHDNIE